MSARKSRVRPVPDFAKAHQLMDMQLAAKKVEMKRYTKVEEFNLTKQVPRGDANEGVLDTPMRNYVVPDNTPGRLCAVGEQRLKCSFADLRPQTEKAAQQIGLQKKCSGILKNPGQRGTDWPLTGQPDQSENVFPIKRPRVTFNLDGPVKHSPRSTAMRVPLNLESPARNVSRSGAMRIPSRGWSPFGTSPMPSRSIYNCSNFPFEMQMSSKSDRQQPPQRVSCSGQRMIESQVGSVAKVIDFNEDIESERKSQTDFHGAEPSAKRMCASVENESSVVCSPLLRLNSNSATTIRSPLSTKDPKQQNQQATKIPLFRRLEGARSKTEKIGKENRFKGGVKISQSEEIIVKEALDDIPEFSDDVSSPRADNLGVKRLKVAQLERKAQRLRRRSQLTDDQSEVDRILKKLESLEMTIRSMRYDLHSVREVVSDVVEDCASLNDQNLEARVSVPESDSNVVERGAEVSSGDTKDDSKVCERIDISLSFGSISENSKSEVENDDSQHRMVEANETVIETVNENQEVALNCDSSFLHAADGYEDKENVNPSTFENRESMDDVAEQCLNLQSSKSLDVTTSCKASEDDGVGSTINALSGHRMVFTDITDAMLGSCENVDSSDEDNVFLVEDSCSSDEPDCASALVSRSPVHEVKQFNGQRLDIENGFSEELMAKLGVTDGIEVDECELTGSPNVSSEFVRYRSYQWREGVDGATRLLNPVATALGGCDTSFVPIVESP